jgi:hypothetical protein
MAEPVFSGPLDQHPFFAAQKEAAQKAAHATAAAGRLAPPKAAVKAAPAKAAPIPRGPASPFTKIPSDALAGAPRLAKAFKNAPPAKGPAPQLPRAIKEVSSLKGLPKNSPKLGRVQGEGPASLGAVEEKGWQNILGTGSVGKDVGSLAGDVSNQVVGAGKALANNPVGTVKHTISSLPNMASSLAGEGLRIGEETGLGAMKKAGFPVAKGEGEPLKTLEEFGKSAVESTGHMLGESQAESQKEAEKEGVAAKVMTFAPIAGGAGAVAGRLAAKAVEESGIGAAEFAAQSAARDAATVAAKDGAMREYLTGGPEGQAWTKAPAELTKAQKTKAFIRESAAESRPNLRTAPGDETAKVERGATVRPQERSGNLFRAMGQTTLDNARRTAQVKGLQRVADERAAFLKSYPDTEAGSVPVTYAQHLGTLTKQGEVTPLFQKGGLRFPGSDFVGATKAQRMGTSYPGGDLRRAGQAARTTVQSDVQDALKELSPVQRKLVVLAKEGHFPLHDPELAKRWLEEISRQAKAGAREKIPLVHKMTGSDVARQVDSALAEMDKKGAASVITPEFEKLVQAIPDERAVSGKDPILKQIPDEVAARKYLPQQQTLDAWARHELDNASAVHPAHPDAQVTADAVKQIYEKLAAGKDLRGKARTVEDAAEGASMRDSAKDLHAQADNHFADAKNLADENAKRQGMPTDRAYIQHQRTRGRENWLHTVGKRAAPDPKKWGSVLQRQGYRTTDPALIEDGMLKSIRNKLATENIAKFDERFRVPGTPDGLTAKEAHALLLKKGLNPDHYEVAHLGKVFHGITDRTVGGADMLHLDLNPLDHAKALGETVQKARGVDPTDTTKGAQIYPTTALKELQGSLSSSALALRAYGQLKGRFSSLMLGTNPGWATTMSAVTYPSQAIMGGAKPWEFPAAVKWYKALGEGDKRSFDLQTGTDNPFRSTHEIQAEKLGSSAKALASHPKLDQITSTMKMMRESPIGKLLHDNRPDRIVLKLERTPRRYARIAVGARHMKGMALDKMIEEAKGLGAAQSKLEKAMTHLQHAGRMPSDQYMQEILKSVPHMEEVAQKTSSMLGEWQKMTNFERNVASKIPLFYPWIRYSVNLATKTLPTNHPLSYALAGQLGVLSREDMRRLLGTDTPVGKAPIGRAQPGKEPAERSFDWAGASQADPLLNQITSIVSGSPAGTVGVLPPFISAPIEWAINRNTFTDKPLRNAEPYVYGQHEENRPPFFGTMAAKGLESFAPGRAAQGLTAKGRPQAANSLLGSTPMQYSPKTEQSIEEQAQEDKQAGLGGKVGKYAIPLYPHKEPGVLSAKLKAQEKQKQKEEVSADAGW